MAIFEIGYLIQKRREELGISQEELADGICATPTLSRIENGTRKPTQAHLEMILQRLGYSDFMMYNLVSKDEFYLHDLKYRIRQAYINGNIDLGKELLDEFERLLKEPTQIDTQFEIMYNTILYSEKYTAEEKLLRFEKAMRTTCPRYGTGKAFYMLSFEEIILLQNIAICYAQLDNWDKCISIFYSILAFYDKHIVNKEEELRMKPAILYNFTCALLQTERYEECVRICKLGIEMSQTTGRCPMFALTLYHMGFALHSLGRIDESKKYFVQAYCMGYAMNDSEAIELTENYVKGNFDDNSFLPKLI